MWSTAPYQRVVTPPFEEVIRPLPIMNAKVARPSGHQMKKPRIMSAIQAGFPNSSSFATIGIAASTVNVNHIYMTKVIWAACQAPIAVFVAPTPRAEARSSPNRADRSAMLPLTNPRETLGTTAALRHLARTVTRCHATAPRCAVSSSRPEDAAAPALWRRAARWRSATRQKHAAPLPVILGSLRAG